MIWFRNVLGISSNRDPEGDEVRALTQQFHITLQAFITKIEESASESPPKALVRIREITSAGDKKLSWKDAYDIEQQLVHLYDEATLKVELERRLLEADTSLHPTVSQWYRDCADKATDQDRKRALLARLINDLQWRYTRNEVRRGYTKQITGRTELVFIISVGLFLFLMLSLLSELASTSGLSVHHWELIPFVGIAGAFGASFSMMTSLRTRLADSEFNALKLNRSVLMILARVLVGMGAGFLLFFLVKSGLLAGEAFPELGKGIGAKAVNTLSAPDFAKLFIWCFIAGFSEKFVPNLLTTTEAQKSGQQTPPATTVERPLLPPAQERSPRNSRAGAGSPGIHEETDKNEERETHLANGQTDS